MKKLLKRILRKTGFQLIKYPNYDLSRRIKIVNYCDVDTLFDIGASTGEYAIKMRELGYNKKIISFEPLKNVFQDLKNASLKDKNWVVENYAIGDQDIEGVINVAGNSDSSSILNMLPMHFNSAPESKYIGQEVIQIRKFDSIFNTFNNKEGRVMIKIDTQGYEKNVIDGANESLDSIRVIQLEMSIISLYEKEMLFIEMVNYLDDRGFQLFSLESGFSDPTTGRLLQVDGIFVKKSFTKNM